MGEAGGDLDGIKAASWTELRTFTLAFTASVDEWDNSHSRGHLLKLPVPHIEWSSSVKARSLSLQ